LIIDNKEKLKEVITKHIENVRITDLHTHLFSKDFQKLLLYGIDELLTYHYLIDEYFRFSNLSYDEFFQLNKREQANLVWKTLFIDHSPVSQAQKDVITILSAFGLDIKTKDLEEYRSFFQNIKQEELVDKVFEIANIKDVIMTNDPFDEFEKGIWEKGGNSDPRFKSALRLDPLLNQYEDNYRKLIDMGYKLEDSITESTITEIKRFLKEWIKKIDAVYVACSMPPDFKVPEDSTRSRIIENCILPICRELNIPFALMIGVKRRVNIKMGIAGDSVGRFEMKNLEYLCKTYTENKFLVTMLSRENQHELAMLGRKFSNLMIFGCWWMVSTSFFVEELTRIRIESLGLSFIPQHSDARVMEQLIYKWKNARTIVEIILFEKYSELFDLGWKLTESDIKRDIDDLFLNNFWNFVNK